MDLLPNDLKYYILVQLGWQELGRICTTNKTFNSLGTNELYWRLKYYSDFNEPYVDSKPAKDGYFNQYRYLYLQKVKDDLYQLIYHKIDQDDKERFPKLFETYFGDFCTNIGRNMDYYKELQVKFFTETNINMSKYHSCDSTWSGKLAAYAHNRIDIADFIKGAINQIITNKY